MSQKEPQVELESSAQEPPFLMQPIASDGPRLDVRIKEARSPNKQAASERFLGSIIVLDKLVAKLTYLTMERRCRWNCGPY
jgi:hypothetical protein